LEDIPASLVREKLLLVVGFLSSTISSYFLPAEAPYYQTSFPYYNDKPS